MAREFKETAVNKTDLKKYHENYDHIFKKAEKMEKIEIKKEFLGPICLHNYPCPVYHDQKAVHVNHEGYFQPSWKAQEDGYFIIRAKTRLQKLIHRLVFN